MASPSVWGRQSLEPVIKRLSDDFFRDPDTQRPKGADFGHLIVDKEKK